MKKNAYSHNIANAINSFLKEDDWNFSFDEEMGRFSFGLSLGSKIKKINYVINVMDDEYIVHAVSSIFADEDDEKMMATLAEFVCRINYSIPFGNFEFDMRDGEIRFKVFVDCEGITPSIDMVRNSILRPANMYEHYGSGFTDIIFGNSTAKKAVDMCEKAFIDEVRSLLSELQDVESDSELSDAIEAFSEHQNSSDDEVSAADGIPSKIKTDLFETGVDKE